MTDYQPELKQIIEGAILAAGEALSIDRLRDLFEESERPEIALIKEALQAIQVDCEGRGFALVEVATGWRFQVASELAPWVNRLWEEKPQKYSRALLETLALVAYRQPLTRSDIEEVRGVAVSSHIIKTLAEREWIKVIGHRDVPGRPSLYATTRQFLDYFGLKSLDELPSLGELKDIDSLTAHLQLEDDEFVLEQEQIAEAKEGEAADGDCDTSMPETDNLDVQSEMDKPPAEGEVPPSQGGQDLAGDEEDAITLSIDSPPSPVLNPVEETYNDQEDLAPIAQPPPSSTSLFADSVVESESERPDGDSDSDQENSKDL